MSNSTAPTGANRYRSLIIFLSVFVLIVVSVLGLNFYASSKIYTDGVAINIAGRQRMLSQKQAKTIPKIFQSQLHNKGTKKAAKEMKDSTNQFGNVLKAFTDGGEVIDSHGKTITLKPIENEAAREILLDANEEWTSYKAAFDKVLTSDVDTLILLGNASYYADSINKELASTTEHLTRLLLLNKSDPENIVLASKLEMLNQQVPKNLYQLVHAQTAHNDLAQITANELRENVYQFDTILKTFSEGGEYVSPNGNSTKIKAIKDSNSLKLIAQIDKQWKPLAASVNKMLSHDIAIIKNLSSLHTMAHTKNGKILSSMNAMTSALESGLEKQSKWLGWVQLGGIILALSMLGSILVFFLKHLKESDKQLDQAMEENDEILSTINDGLFLIDQDHNIGQQHSKSLSNVINIEEPAGENFLSILGNIVPENTVKVASEYLDLLYGDRVHEELIGDLNPLDQVEVYFEGEDFEKKLGYLAFDFKRVTKNGNIPHLLVQVEDISEKVILEKQLSETQDESQKQFDLMLQVLHVQPKILIQFLADTNYSLSKINEILQQHSGNLSSAADNEVVLTQISRYMHRIKGDASGLQLTAFEQKAHEFEDLFSSLKNKKNFSGKDFLPVVIKLEEFLKQLGSLRAMIDKLADLKEAMNADGDSSLLIDSANNTKMSTILNILVNTVATRQKKNVILNIFNEHLLPENYRKPIHDILTQLIRNSIVHGIESSEERQRLHKTNEGVIAVKFFTNAADKTLTVKYLDNGRGLQRAKILNQAINHEIIEQDDALKMSDEEIYALIFKSGLSTKSSADKDSGRGVGMDLVGSIIQKYNGKIKIRSIADEIFKVEITLPLMHTNEVNEEPSETPKLEEV